MGNRGDADDDESSVLETIKLKGLLLLRGCAKIIISSARRIESSEETASF